MYGNQVIAIFQLVSVMMCAAVAFGLLISTMLVRGKLHKVGQEGPLHDIAFTESAYVAAATMCALAAIASINISWGTFALCLSIAVSLMIADTILVPRMREAIAASREVPYTGTRLRFEVLAAASLFFVFWKTAVPPLLTLAQIYGLG